MRLSKIKKQKHRHTLQTPPDLITDDFEEYDNPLRNQRNSNFLKTNFRLSINDLKSPPSHQRNFRGSLKLQKQERSLEKQNKEKLGGIVIRQMPPCKIQNSFLSKKFGEKDGKIVVERFKKSVWEDYKIVDKLGEGAFGKVYRAKNCQSHEIRAIKSIKNNFLQQKSQAQILSQCRHPNIIQIYQIYESEQQLQMVLEECRGGSLMKLLRKLESNEQRILYFSEKVVKTIIRQVLNALSYLHSKLIVHSDIKLQNIAFLYEICSQADLHKNTVKLIDFGLAKRTKYKVIKQEAVGGTKAYMPPQSAQGWISDKSDIWGCGIVLYVLLSGKFPFKRRKRTSTMRASECEQVVEFEGSEWEGVSKQGKELVSRMLQKNFGRRPSAQQCLQFEWLKDEEQNVNKQRNKKMLKIW